MRNDGNGSPPTLPEIASETDPPQPSMPPARMPAPVTTSPTAMPVEPCAGRLRQRKIVRWAVSLSGLVGLTKARGDFEGSREVIVESYDDD